MTDSKILFSRALDDPSDFALRMVLADAIQDEGDEELAVAHRAMAVQGLWPFWFGGRLGAGVWSLENYFSTRASFHWWDWYHRNNSGSVQAGFLLHQGWFDALANSGELRLTHEIRGEEVFWWKTLGPDVPAAILALKEAFFLLPEGERRQLLEGKCSPPTPKAFSDRPAAAPSTSR